MKMSFLRSSLASKLTASLAIALGITATNLMAVDEVGFDDFEGLTLGPYIYENSNVAPGADGTDYTLDLPTGWVRDNSLLTAPSGEGPWWDGGVVHDMSSWSSHDFQLRTTSGALGARNSRNSVVVFDPDEWDDGGTGGGDNGFNSYLYKTFTTTGDSSQTAVSFDFEFRAYSDMTLLFQVTTDDPTSELANWETFAQWGPVDGTNFVNSEFSSGIGQTYSVANGDFADPGNTFTLRFGCINGGNDWWCAVDNIEVSTDTFSELADFEGLTMEAYGSSTPAPAGTPIGDGTDWTDDIPGWTSDLSGMQYVRAAPCWEGFTAHDAWSFDALGGGQERGTFFGDYFDPDPFALIISEDPNNTILVADGDEWSDNPVIQDNGIVPDVDEFNAYIWRAYDLNGFANDTLTVTFDWQHRWYDDQRPLLQVSFDGGSTWTTIWEMDSSEFTAGNTDYIDSFAAFAPTGDLSALPADSYQSGGFFDVLTDDFIPTPQTIAIDPATVGLNAFNAATEMRLRIGYVDAGDDWWFAVDNILVEADPQDFVLGDANDDGAFNNADINAIILALTNRAAYDAAYPTVDADQVLDFNGDGAVNNADINGMIEVLTQ